MLRSAATRWAWWALLSLAVLGFGHLCAVQGNDFVAFHDVAQLALRHGDVYAEGERSHMHIPYVPWFGLLVAPLGLLDPYAAAWVWYLLKLAALAAVVRWAGGVVAAAAPAASRRLVAAYLALALLAALNPLMSEFRLGQANLFVLLFSILAVRALRSGRSLLAAVLFSLAAVKVTALALLPWLALRRQWRFFGALALVGAGWLLALAAWWGPGRVYGLFDTWIRYTAADRGALPRVAYFENQSLQGVAARLAERLPALQASLAGSAAYQWLWILPCAALVGVLALSAARDRFGPHLPPEEFGLVSLLMLLASADSRYAHHVQLLVPLATVAALAASSRLLEAVPRLGPWLAGGEVLGGAGAGDPRLRRATGAILAAGIFVYVLLGRDVVGPAASQAARALGAGTAYDLALAVFLGVRLLRHASRPAATADAALG